MFAGPDGTGPVRMSIRVRCRGRMTASRTGVSAVRRCWRRNPTTTLRMDHKTGSLRPCGTLGFMDEVWLAVGGYEGLYEVSDAGRVRSLPRGGTRGGVLRGDLHRAGYPCVRLSKEGHKTHLTVHSLVAKAFLGQRPDGMECRHINGDPSDNRAENLAWGTSSENSHDMVLHGRTNKRITHCPSGHEYTSENIQWYQGRRYCRACNRVRTRERQRHVRAERKRSSL